MSEKKDVQTLSWQFSNDGCYVSGVDICAKDKEVEIWVEDGYYDFKIPFETFLEIAKKVKEQISNGKSNN